MVSSVSRTDTEETWNSLLSAQGQKKTKNTYTANIQDSKSWINTDSVEDAADVIKNNKVVESVDCLE